MPNEWVSSISWTPLWNEHNSGVGLEQSMHAQPQAYTRLSDHVYLFENLDGSGFSAELTVDGDGIVVDYPGFFRRAAI